LKTLIVGLGNPILGDDGIGWRVAQKLQDSGKLPKGVDVVYLAVGGISLMEALVGYAKALIIDAITTNNAPVGTVRSFLLEDLSSPSAGHLSSVHDTSLQNAMQIGRDLKLELPAEIIVISIEAMKIYDFSEELSPEVAAAIPEAMRITLELLSSSHLLDREESNG
jgi:hydrogenase maturation protease